MINLNLSDALIKQIKRVTKVHGQCYITGCGNMFFNKADAKMKTEFPHNPDSDESKMMLSFYNVNEVPNTVKELEDAFFKSYREESQNANRVERKENKNFIDMSDEDESEQIDKIKTHKHKN